MNHKIIISLYTAMIKDTASLVQTSLLAVLLQIQNGD